MEIIRLVKRIIICILVSFFYFPFEFTILPGINTKMMLAVLGLLFVMGDLLNGRRLMISKDFIILTSLANVVSLVSLYSITANHTMDTAYVLYIVSFSVWLSAAYATCHLIKETHNDIIPRLVLDYLIGVCLIQCVSAIWIDSTPSVARFVNRNIAFGQEISIGVKRLYGLGATLDVAGSRFAAVLVGLGYYLSQIKEPLSNGRRTTYIIAFIVITVIGNMIARTTLIGALLGLGIILLGFLFKPTLPGENYKATSFLTWMIILTVGITTCVVLYNTDPAARKLFRFGFEGFFSLAENGHWETSSTEKLTQTMVVFPDTIHTWIIGDGYFLSPHFDKNYLGTSTDLGFYMGTDVGYLRFIFYFGIIGLIPMMGVIIYSAIICMRHFPQEKLLFFLALLVGLIVWFKVSTDIFLFFALFLSAAALQEPSKEQHTTTQS